MFRYVSVLFLFQISFFDFVHCKAIISVYEAVMQF